MLVFEIFWWIIFCYGLLSFTRDIVDEYTYKKINNSMKIYITLKNVDENIEYFIREISSIKRKNKFKSISIINLDAKKEDDKILEKLQDDLKIKIINYENFIEKIKS